MKLFFIVILCFAYVPLFSFTDTNELIFVEDESSRDQSSSGGSEDENVPTKIFKATNEWREIGNYVLPKGLHVRINLETGKKEAKLLESSSEVDVHSRITSNYQIVEKQAAEASAESLKRLNDFKDISKSNSIKYKNIQEIKDIGVKVTSESALLEEAMSRYINEKDEKNKLSHLSDIEYFVHSIDLANDFFQSGGLSIMLKDLNQTNSLDIKLGILSVIGASIQGNIQLKSELFKLDFLRQIVVLLNNAKEVQLEKKSLFVLGALVRNFPLAQRALFHSFNGLDILETLLSKDRYLVTRATAFLSDIAIEISSVKENVDKQEIYGQAQFEAALKNSAVCQKLIETVIDDRELDRSFLGTMIDSLNGLSNVCNFHSNKSFVKALSKLSQSFSSDDFISDSIAKLLVNLNVKDEL